VAKRLGEIRDHAKGERSSKQEVPMSRRSTVLRAGGALLEKIDGYPAPSSGDRRRSRGGGGGGADQARAARGREAAEDDGPARATRGGGAQAVKDLFGQEQIAVVPLDGEKGQIERGAFFTPGALALAICRTLKGLGVAPGSIFEPGCGGGAFLRAADATWPAASLFGVDLLPACEGPGVVCAGPVQGQRPVRPRAREPGLRHRRAGGAARAVDPEPRRLPRLPSARVVRGVGGQGAALQGTRSGPGRWSRSARASRRTGRWTSGPTRSSSGSRAFEDRSTGDWR
jgi:hypothetical protein